MQAARQIKQKVVKAAAHIFKVDEEEIVYEEGKAFVRREPDKSQTLQEIALALWYAWDIPKDMEPSLEATSFLDPPGFNFSYGAHVAVVEVDEQTGQVDVVRFFGVHDAGVVGNTRVFEGQMQGGITHGIGQALYEQAIYNQDGQLLTASLTEYALPRATQLPMFDLDRLATPTPHTQLGAKGAGELGAVGAAAAVANAVCDALSDLGVKHIEMPITPEKVWRAMRDAKAAWS